MNNKLDAQLYLACRDGDLDKIKSLVSNGVDIHAKDGMALITSAYMGRLEAVKYFIHNGINVQSQDNYALRTAAEQDYLTVVRCLIENGANIQSQNHIILKESYNKGHIEMIKYIYELYSELPEGKNLFRVLLNEQMKIQNHYHKFHFAYNKAEQKEIKIWWKYQGRFNKLESELNNDNKLIVKKNKI